MADLKAELEGEGFANVATVVASGNVLFDHSRAADPALGGEIEALVKRAFGIASFAAVRTRAEIARAVADNPFAHDGEDKFVHTLFLEHPLARADFDRFAAEFAGPERVAMGDGVLYADYAVGVGRSALDPAMRKAKLIKGRATARNMRSLRRILDKMDD